MFSLEIYNIFLLKQFSGKQVFQVHSLLSLFPVAMSVSLLRCLNIIILSLNMLCILVVADVSNAQFVFFGTVICL